MLVTQLRVVLVKTPKALTDTTGVCAQVIECFSLDLRLVKLVPVNYCFYKKEIILKLFSVACRYYETSGVVGC